MPCPLFERGLAARTPELVNDIPISLRPWDGITLVQSTIGSPGLRWCRSLAFQTVSTRLNRRRLKGRGLSMNSRLRLRRGRIERPAHSRACLPIEIKIREVRGSRIAPNVRQLDRGNLREDFIPEHVRELLANGGQIGLQLDMLDSLPHRVIADIIHIDRGRH